MSNDLMDQLNAEHLAKGKDIFEQLKEQGSDLSPMEQLQFLAKAAKGPVDSFMADNGNEKIAEIAEAIHEALTNIEEQQFAMANLAPMLASRDMVKAQVEKIASQMVENKKENGVQAQKGAEKSAETPRDARISMTKTVNEVLPKTLRAFFDQLSGTTGLSYEEQVDKSVAKLESTTAEERAAADLEKWENLPVDIITDAVMEVVAKISGPAAKTLRDEFTARVSATDLVQLGQSGAAFAQEAIDKAVAGDLKEMQFSSRAKVFGAQLEHVLQSLEDAILAADLVNDTPDLGDRIRESYDAPVTPEA